MRIWPFVLGATLLVAAKAQEPQPQHVDGSWIDSQCNEYQFQQNGELLKILSPRWKYDASAIRRVYEGQLDLGGTVTPEGFEAVQRSIDVRIQGALREKWIDAKISVGADTFDVPLCPRASRLAMGCSVQPGGKPTRLEIRSAAVSNAPGGVVPAMVYVLDEQGRPTRTREDLHVKLSGAGSEQNLVVAQNAPFAATFIPVSRQGRVDVRAEAAGVASDTKTLFGCSPEAPRGLSVFVREPRPVVGSTEPVTIAIFGAVSGPAEMPLDLSWEQGSVGKLLNPDPLKIAPGQCAAEALLTSTEPGNSKLTVRAAAAELPAAAIALLWRRTMTPLLVALAALGGLIGALLTRLFQHSRKWRLKDAWLAVRGPLAAIVVYVMYFNLMATVRDPGGNVAAFAVGAAAGYTGKAALDWLSRKTLDGAEPPKKDQSLRAKTA